jgi:hypothetical protein
MNCSGILFLLVSVFVVIGCAAQSAEAGVRVSNLAASGAFEVRNDGSSEVSLAREVTVEQLSEGRWERADVAIELLEKCGVASVGKCVKLAAGAVLRPVPWNGFSCAPQCPGPCRANVYMGPGTFRFVVSTCDRKHRLPGPAFTIPAQAK